ncbi:DNA polymerase III subunit beta [Rickettsia endosymbiont of Cardiosporidium cionae]|uniref:DNA polymerase III subunit beta n=1 Tax=Rickettsia endosymbiont of Cardiosporidium cionae TaxID=2777155 RepID=UPI00189306EE|nr:DNA polymerase III subunit beta [Rickettsia endosymbiont of Cardiosporidium cionae]KAF8818726.1 DNA polymerase III subunit beta [Rickettsia endosymbiont of Cardiosporidium cionae]
MKEAVIEKNKQNIPGASCIVGSKILYAALSFMNLVIEKRNILKSLQYIKIKLSNTTLTLESTDMDIYLYNEIEAKIINAGYFLVHSQVLLDILRKVNTQEIEIKQDTNLSNIQLLTKECSFNLFSLPVDQFPNIDYYSPDYNQIIEIGSDNLLKIISNTIASVSYEDTRYNINGIFLHILDNKILSASTDAHRFSLSSATIDSNINKFEIILHRKAAHTLLKILKDISKQNISIKVFLGKHKIKLNFNNFILISKLIDAKFPDYNHFIPNDNNNILYISSKLILEAINRVTTVVLDNFLAVKIIIDNECVMISASGEDIGNATEKIYFNENTENICKFQGTKLSIKLNPKYIIDILEVIKDQNIRLCFKNSSSSVLIKDDSDNIFVIMPLRG